MHANCSIVLLPCLLPLLLLLTMIVAKGIRFRSKRMLCIHDPRRFEIQRPPSLNSVQRRPW